MKSDDIPTPIHIPKDALGSVESLQRIEQIRRAITNRMLEDEDILDDPKRLAALAAMLDSTDRQALGVLRIETAKSAAQGIGDLASALDAIVVNAGVAFQRPPDAPTDGGYKPAIPELPETNLKPGVLDPVGTNVDIMALLDADLENRKA